MFGQRPTTTFASGTTYVQALDLLLLALVLGQLFLNGGGHRRKGKALVLVPKGVGALEIKGALLGPAAVQFLHHLCPVEL